MAYLMAISLGDRLFSMVCSYISFRLAEKEAVKSKPLAVWAFSCLLVANSSRPEISSLSATTETFGQMIRALEVWSPIQGVEDDGESAVALSSV